MKTFYTVAFLKHNEGKPNLSCTERGRNYLSTRVAACSQAKAAVAHNAVDTAIVLRPDGSHYATFRSPAYKRLLKQTVSEINTTTYMTR